MACTVGTSGKYPIWGGIYLIWGVKIGDFIRAQPPTCIPYLNFYTLALSERGTTLWETFNFFYYVYVVWGSKG